MLCCCFTSIAVIELSFAVAFLLIMKTRDDQFACKMGGRRILRNGGGGGLIPLYGLGIVC